MDIIEANECLKTWYGKPRKGTFGDNAVGVEGEQRDKPGGGGKESDEDASPASTVDEEVGENVASHISTE
jgi:hypothetical protein